MLPYELLTFALLFATSRHGSEGDDVVMTLLSHDNGVFRFSCNKCEDNNVEIFDIEAQQMMSQATPEAALLFNSTPEDLPVTLEAELANNAENTMIVLGTYIGDRIMQGKNDTTYVLHIVKHIINPWIVASPENMTMALNYLGEQGVQHLGVPTSG